MKIVFYNLTLIVGGIEKALEILIEELSKENEIHIVYTETRILDERVIKILSKNAKVYQLTEPIECDICVWCRIYFDYYNIKNLIRAKKYISWVHSKPRELENCLLDNQDFVNDSSEFVCVSETVKNELNISKEGIVIYNSVDKNIKNLANEFEINRDTNILNLVVVSRLSKDKGFYRLYEFVKELHEKGVAFKLQIVGNGRKFEEEIRNMFKIFEAVEFVGYKQNPYPYIKNADYLLQLSDYESFCLSVTEAKILGTPCIVTNYPSSTEQVTDKVNGIILPLENKTYYEYLDDIVSNKSRYKKELEKFEYINDIETWRNILTV